MGFFQRTKEKAGSGAKAMVNYQQIASVGGWIKQSALALSPWKKREGARIETFREAVARMGVSEEDLAKQYQNHVLRFYLVLLVWIIGTLVMAIYLARGSWITILPYLGFSAICTAQFFSASLWAMQIRKREFVGGKNWFAMRGEWFPTMLELPPAKESRVRKAASSRNDKKQG